MLKKAWALSVSKPFHGFNLFLPHRRHVLLLQYVLHWLFGSEVYSIHLLDQCTNSRPISSNNARDNVQQCSTDAAIPNARCAMQSNH